MTKYDSTLSTLEHKRTVQNLLTSFAAELLARGCFHDDSKLESPEKELFDKYTPLLETLEYGSEEYKQSLELLKPALEHHYANNPHHPQYYPNGVNGMTLFDIVEMFLDWSAAVERTKDGDIYKSLEINEKRFGINPQLTQIFKNTVDAFTDN